MTNVYNSPGVYVEQLPSGSAPIAGVGTSTAGFVGVVPDSIPRPGDQPPFTPAAVGEVVLVTNFTEFKNAFGDFSAVPGHNELVHAVYGFFLNGGTRCFVTRVPPPVGAPDIWPAADIAPALERFEPIDEISIVVAPGLNGPTPMTALAAHCKKMETCVAIVDAPRDIANLDSEFGPNGTAKPSNSDAMALYLPWIQVYDPASKLPQFVPPSGHIAGIYARVDARRGVHKAPANEVILGAQGLKMAISRAQQDGLNPKGVNCIRKLNGNIRVWGARTLGGEDNTDFKYINVRRVFNFLRASIDQGTQWAVFEPNNPDLWAKITRNVSAFLNNVWASGALFGDTAQEAFYVKCDAETNPPSERDLGKVITEIGVAVTRPAEFVIFRLGQKAAF